jgi:rubredoxin
MHCSTKEDAEIVVVVELSWKNKAYKCETCGYVYNPERGEPNQGIAPGTQFEDLPEGYTCPVCGAGKSGFDAMKEETGRYLCVACGYIYDPERGEPKHGIKAGTSFESLPDDYVCPVCGVYAKVGKSAFIATD